MKKRYPIGVDDFKKIVDEDLYFVDKTMFIKEIIDDGSEVILIARPRRFGKTLNMSILKYYFEKDDCTKKNNNNLFEKLDIWKTDEVYKKEYNKYPVINFTFKGIKMYSWEDNFESIKLMLMDEFINHKYVLNSDILENSEIELYNSIISRKANKVECTKSLNILSRALYKYHNQKVIILIDEYDTLLNEAYIHGFYEEAIEFMRTFLNEGLKNNIYLHKAVLTGIFRVAKESIFSDMNNLKVCTMLSDSYSDKFGFTTDEVKEMLGYYGINEKIDNVANWYNGYIFGRKKDITIYNPWSIMMYLDSRELGPYWINTSGNAIIKHIAANASISVQKAIKDILEGSIVEYVRIDENIIYNEIMNDDESIWSFLLMSGYLKAVKKDIREDGIYCTLAPPNKEIFYFYRNIISSWLREAISGGSVSDMLKALLIGDIETFESIFSDTVLKSVGFNDVGDDTSENFYHAFVLGMLVYLDKEYEIKSNRESGLGRYDVMIIPKNINKKGIIIEFKKASKKKNETIEEALENAKKQIEKKKYEIELRQRGINDIMKLAIAFKGKEVLMESW